MLSSLIHLLFLVLSRVVGVGGGVAEGAAANPIGQGLNCCVWRELDLSCFIQEGSSILTFFFIFGGGGVIRTWWENMKNPPEGSQARFKPRGFLQRENSGNYCITVVLKKGKQQGLLLMEKLFHPTKPSAYRALKLRH